MLALNFLSLRFTFSVQMAGEWGNESQQHGTVIGQWRRIPRSRVWHAIERHGPSQ